MKLRLPFLLLLPTCLSLFSCSDVGSKFTDDPLDYGEIALFLTFPTYFPENLDGFVVNAYSYRLENYMDTCYEIFLDLTVTGAQLETLIAHVKDYKTYQEHSAYYQASYQEIVFENTYEVHQVAEDTSEEFPRVGLADIEKVIYNEATGSIVFTCFHAHDTGVYRLDQLAYFSRFSINELEYIQHLN